MRQRKIKLGKGELEFIHEDGLSLSIKDARDYFLDAVKEVKPEVLDDLANEPFKLYKAAGLAFDREQIEKDIENTEFYDQIRIIAKEEQQHKWNHPDWQGHFEEKEVDYDDNILAMQKSIFDWSRKHNLNVAWCRARAYETLDYWHQNTNLCVARIWNYDVSLEPIIAIRRGELDFVFRFKSLYPAMSFRADEKKRITEQFEFELDAFLDERENYAKEKGLKKPKKKNEYLHFLWFAHYQVNELTQKEIQENYNPFYASRRTIGEAIESIRNILKTPSDPQSELTRPPSKVGRPRKK